MPDLSNMDPLSKYSGMMVMSYVENLWLNLEKPAYCSTNCQVGVTATKGWNNHTIKTATHPYQKTPQTL